MSPDDKEFIELVKAGLKAEMDQCIQRFLDKMGLPYDTPCTPELARKLERYMKLNPGGHFSPDSVTVYPHDK